MDRRRLQAIPGLGQTVFADPEGGRYEWAFVVFTVALTAYLSYDRAVRVGVLAGLPLVLLAVSQVLPERRYSLAVGLQLLGLISFVGVWIGILVYFPDAPTFFAGDW